MRELVVKCSTRGWILFDLIHKLVRDLCEESNVEVNEAEITGAILEMALIEHGDEILRIQAERTERARQSFMEGARGTASAEDAGISNFAGLSQSARRTLAKAAQAYSKELRWPLFTVRKGRARTHRGRKEASTEVQPRIASIDFQALLSSTTEATPTGKKDARLRDSGLLAAKQYQELLSNIDNHIKFLNTPTEKKKRVSARYKPSA